MLELISLVVICCKILLPESATANKDFPEPVVFLPLNEEHGTRDISKSYLPTTANDITLAPGPDGQPNGSYAFPGNDQGYIEIPKTSKTYNTRNKMSFFTWIYNQGTYGPVLNYETDDKTWGLHVYIHRSPSDEFYVCLVSKDRTDSCTSIISSRILKNAWTFVGFTYDKSVRKLRLFIDGVLAKEAVTPEELELHTELKIRIGGTKNLIQGPTDAFTGRLSCIQIYDTALTEQQVKRIQQYCDRNDIFKPCFNHEVLEKTSRHLRPAQIHGKEAKSDRTKIARTHWYQFPGKRILSFCPKSSSCGDQPPGWLNGQYPSREDGIKKMELCYRKDSDCCSSKVSVLVRQCYGYYVFKFEDFPEDGRFCAEEDTSTFKNVMFMPTNERCLIDHVIYTADDVETASKCVGYCLNAGRMCKSINFINEGSGRCQLNNATKAEGPLREDSKCSYYEII